MKNKKASNEIKISHLISLPACTLYILSSIIFYGVLETDMPLVLYVTITFFIGVSVIFSFYEFKFDKDINSQKKIQFYFNTITFVCLILHFNQSADRMQRTVKDFNWAAMFEPNWNIFIPFGITIVTFMTASWLIFGNPFYPIINSCKTIFCLIKNLFQHIRKNF